jgi:hypothetical protein
MSLEIWLEAELGSPAGKVFALAQALYLSWVQIEAH